MVQRQIAEFHQDEVGDWVAVLACGHSRHMRHHPPGRTALGSSHLKDARATSLARSIARCAMQKGNLNVSHAERWTWPFR
jgi:hypothetical protein